MLNRKFAISLLAVLIAAGAARPSDAAVRRRYWVGDPAAAYRNSVNQANRLAWERQQRERNAEAAKLGRQGELFQAIQAKNSVTVETLLKQGANANTKDAAGETPLIDAALTGSVEVVNVLIVHGAQINAVDGGGHTALMAAAKYANAAMLATLLAHGASVNMREAGGYAALTLRTKGDIDAFDFVAKPYRLSEIVKKLR